MKSPPFSYARAESVDDALGLLADGGEDAKLLAGGQSLVPALAYRLARPSHLVDIDRVPGLDTIGGHDGELEIGALVRHAALEHAPLAGAHRLLAEAAAHIGHVPIRTRGTLGGSLAHADPAAELPVAALALDARVVVRSSRGVREIPAQDFALGPFMTAVAPDEMVVALRVPAAAPRSFAAFREFALRAGDFALAAAGIVIACDADGAVLDARIVVGAVEPAPRRLHPAEAPLLGERPTVATIAAAAGAAAAACEPVDDRAIDETTRRELVAALVRRALSDAGAQVVA